MMKKLLILMLVLGMTSAASATLTWSVSEITLNYGDVAVVQLVSDSDQPYTAQWVGADPSPTGVASITAMTALPAAAEGGAALTAYPGWWQVEAVDFTPPSDIAVGDHFDVTITAGTVDGTYTINADYGTEIGRAHV